MRLTILIMCALVAAGVFAAMFLAIWRARRDGSRPGSRRQSLATEFLWAAIPCLMIAAAAMPAAIAIATSSSDDSQAVSGSRHPAQARASQREPGSKAPVVLAEQLHKRGAS